MANKRTKAAPIPAAEKSPTLDIETAAGALGIKRDLAYKLARANDELMPGVPVFRIGAKWRVPTAALRRALGLDAQAS
jgi:hypothetical protein